MPRYASLDVAIPWLYLNGGVQRTQMRQAVAALVVIGVNARGEKHFLTIEDGVRGPFTMSADQINLKGESMRKRRPALTQTDHRS